MVELAHRLLRQTKNAKISWQPVDEDGEKFIYSSLKSSTVIELYDVDGDGNREIRLTLLNSHGTKVDSLEKEWEIGESDEVDAAAWNDVLDELYDQAKDAALSVTETFKDIFSSLADE
jgi:hypothetical protein